MGMELTRVMQAAQNYAQNPPNSAEAIAALGRQLRRIPRLPENSEEIDRAFGYLAQAYVGLNEREPVRQPDRQVREVLVHNPAERALNAHNDLPNLLAQLQNVQLVPVVVARGPEAGLQPPLQQAEPAVPEPNVRIDPPAEQAPNVQPIQPMPVATVLAQTEPPIASQATELSLWERIWNIVTTTLQQFVNWVLSVFCCLPRAVASAPQPQLLQHTAVPSHEALQQTQPQPVRAENQGGQQLPAQAEQRQPLAPVQQQEVPQQPAQVENQVEPQQPPAIDQERVPQQPQPVEEVNQEVHEEQRIKNRPYSALQFISFLWNQIIEETDEELEVLANRSFQQGAEKRQRAEVNQNFLQPLPEFEQLENQENQNNFQEILTQQQGQNAEVLLRSFPELKWLRSQLGLNPRDQIQRINMIAINRPQHVIAVQLTKQNEEHALLIDATNQEQVHYYHYKPQTNEVWVFAGMNEFIQHLEQTISNEREYPLIWTLYSKKRQPPQQPA